jgi:hypothetical protein
MKTLSVDASTMPVSGARVFHVQLDVQAVAILGLASTNVFLADPTDADEISTDTISIASPMSTAFTLWSTAHSVDEAKNAVAVRREQEVVPAAMSMLAIAGCGVRDGVVMLPTGDRVRMERGTVVEWAFRSDPAVPPLDPIRLDVAAYEKAVNAGATMMAEQLAREAHLGSPALGSVRSRSRGAGGGPSRTLRLAQAIVGPVLLLACAIAGASELYARRLDATREKSIGRQSDVHRELFPGEPVPVDVVQSIESRSIAGAAAGRSDSRSSLLEHVITAAANEGASIDSIEGTEGSIVITGAFAQPSQLADLRRAAFDAGWTASAPDSGTEPNAGQLRFRLVMTRHRSSTAGGDER